MLSNLVLSLKGVHLKIYMKPIWGLKELGYGLVGQCKCEVDGSIGDPFNIWQLWHDTSPSMCENHYYVDIMSAMASQITGLRIVYSIVYSDAGQRKHQCSASLAFVRGIHRRPVNSQHKGPVTRKMFPFDDVIMSWSMAAALFPHINATAIS